MDTNLRADRALTLSAEAGSRLPDSRIAPEMRGITKHSGRLTALSAVSFTLRRETLHALLGENGAGKTTLMRIAFGMITPDAGEIHVGGREIEHRPQQSV